MNNGPDGDFFQTNNIVLADATGERVSVCVAVRGEAAAEAEARGGAL